MDLLNSNTTQQIKYAIKVNGQVVTPLCDSEAHALSFTAAFPPNIRALAEVVKMTPEGQLLLLG